MQACAIVALSTKRGFMIQYNLIWTDIFTGIVTHREIIAHHALNFDALDSIAEENALSYDLKRTAW